MLQYIDKTIEDERGNEPEPAYKYSISSYAVEFNVLDLVQRITKGEIYIPDFQKQHSWDQQTAARFIESLLLDLPVQSIFLSREKTTNNLLVVDGQQRLRTLHAFFKGHLPNSNDPFELKGVQNEFNGKTYNTLHATDRTQLDNALIHTVIIKQINSEHDDSSLFLLFERLNVGKVSSQQIRSAIYSGAFSKLLTALNQNSSWRAIYRGNDPYQQDQELILRFLALYFDLEAYVKPLDVFLNTFVSKNRHLQIYSNQEIEGIFTQTIEVIHKAVGNKAFRTNGNINAAIFDSIMVGIASRIAKDKINDYSSLRSKYEVLLNDKDYLEAVTSDTSAKQKVKTRINLAKKAFADLA